MKLKLDLTTEEALMLREMIGQGMLELTDHCEYEAGRKFFDCYTKIFKQLFVKDMSKTKDICEFATQLQNGLTLMVWEDPMEIAVDNENGDFIQIGDTHLQPIRKSDIYRILKSLSKLEGDTNYLPENWWKDDQNL